MNRPILIARNEGIALDKSPGVAFYKRNSLTIAISSANAGQAVELMARCVPTDPPVVYAMPLSFNSFFQVMQQKVKHDDINKRITAIDPGHQFFKKLEAGMDPGEAMQSVKETPLDRIYFGVGGSIAIPDGPPKTAAFYILGE